MSAQQQRDRELGELAHLLDAYGSDSARWPQSRRQAARALIDTVPTARALYEEARALDRTLDTAREPVSQSNVARTAALADRIAAAAGATRRPTPQLATSVANVVALPRRSTTSAATGSSGISRQRKIAGLLAACLLAGIWLGGGVPLDQMLLEVADAVGVHAEYEPTHMAFAEDVYEEDQL